MMGDAEAPGVIPRMASELFFCVDKALAQSPDTKFLLTCSYLEIYNEVLHDLLTPPPKKGEPKQVLEVGEHPSLGVHVKGLLERPVRCEQDVLSLLTAGSHRRATAATLMNDRSSRSHSIFVIWMQRQEAVAGSEQQRREISARINLVDLAGSERMAKTGTTGQQAKEGININQSLSALGSVIIALAESARKGRPQFVPYRNSKLTRVLQESLGGNALTVMIANVSAERAHLEESTSTLQYADRAKAIKVQAKRNEQVSEAGRLRQEVEALRRKLAEQVGVAGAEEQPEVEQYRRQIEEYEARLQQSFDAKELACRKLEARLQAQQDELERSHAERRQRHAQAGQAEGLLWAANPAWQGCFLEEMERLAQQGREAEASLAQGASFVAVLLQARAIFIPADPPPATSH